MSLPLMLNTQMSPALNGLSVIAKNKISPLSNAGLMLSLNTTTIGLSLFNKTPSPFQIINAVITTAMAFINWPYDLNINEDMIVYLSSIHAFNRINERQHFAGELPRLT